MTITVYYHSTGPDATAEHITRFEATTAKEGYEAGIAYVDLLNDELIAGYQLDRITVQ